MAPEDSRHGTNAGYLAHRRDGESACAACRAARVAYEKRRTYDRHVGKPRLIDVTGTRRRIEALVALGWTYRAIGAEVGISLSGVHKAVNRCTVIRRDVAGKYAAAYERMSMTLPPTETRQQKRDAAYARTVARKRGWLPPLAWDDIDDPNEEPTGWRYQPTDRAEAIRDMADMGLGVTEVARRLHTSTEALQAWCMRKGMSAAYRQLAAREALRENQWTRKDGAA